MPATKRRVWRRENGEEIERVLLDSAGPLDIDYAAWFRVVGFGSRSRDLLVLGSQ